MYAYVTLNLELIINKRINVSFRRFLLLELLDLTIYILLRVLHKSYTN